MSHFHTAVTGRSFDEGRGALPEVIEDLVPDSNTVAMVLRELAISADRWHDEL